MMRIPLLCVLGSVLLNTHLYGQAQVAHSAVVTRQPNWPKIYNGETITLRCETENGGDSEWEYEWRTTSSIKPPNKNYFSIIAYSVHSGKYWCRGRNKTGQQFTTEWSDAFNLPVSCCKPRPVLTVSPSWLSPGASVTLKCEIEHPSAGWRFYWYKAVPKPPEKIYKRRLLPGNSNGTEQDSYIVHGQTHTARYSCRAGRGAPVYYSDFCSSKFAWSKDVHPSASLTVSPDRVQHFISEYITLSCEGNSIEWNVRRFTDRGALSDCHNWGRMIGSTCTIFSLQFSDAVYWCESGSGEFSNAVNITIELSKPESSSFIVTLFTGVLIGLFLMIFLLLLFCVMKSKDLCGKRASQSLGTNQNLMVNQDEALQHVGLYSSLLKDDVCIYESIRGAADTGNDGRGKEYSGVKFHSIQPKRLEHDEPEESSDYCVDPLSTTGMNK
ncbi:uncharacterized protein [Trachinotus anak]|uniref:uncharacterized protein n=1 Tax=Trachinotus anak TaxID=443729 RepID=UPI0039F1CDD0